MSVTSGTSNNTNDLLLHIDAYNSYKSWKGQPVTNYIPNPYASWNGSSFVFGYNNPALGATYTYRTGVPNPVDAPGVMEYYTGTLGYKYFSIDTTSLPSTGTYTFSYYARIVGGPTGTGTFSNNQLWRANGSDRAVSGDWNPSYTPEWKRYSTSGPAEAGTVLQYFLVHGGNIFADYTIQYCGFQLEFGSYASPLAIGTRSNTQAVVDLTGNNTLTANSLTYNSDGTFSFNGSNNYISVPTGSTTNPGSRSFTFQIWAYITGASPTSWHMLVANRGQGGTGGYYVGLNDTTGGNFMLTNDAGTRTDTSTTGTPTWQYNKWVMVTAILDRAANTQTLIINDNAQSFAITPGGGNYANTSPLNIGGDVGAGSYYTNGKIGSLKVYNRALSISEVKDNFNALKSKFGL